MTTTEPGLDILNVGHGHIEITFKKEDVIEATRAKRIIQDMLKRGYALFVDLGTDKGLHRVKRFDAEHERYIIADGPEIPAELVDEPTPKLKAKHERAVPMKKVRTTAVGRSAGG